MELSSSLFLSLCCLHQTNLTPLNSKDSLQICPAGLYIGSYIYYTPLSSEKRKLSLGPKHSPLSAWPCYLKKHEPEKLLWQPVICSYVSLFSVFDMEGAGNKKQKTKKFAIGDESTELMPTPDITVMRIRYKHTCISLRCDCRTLLRASKERLKLTVVVEFVLECQTTVAIIA